MGKTELEKFIRYINETGSVNYFLENDKILINKILNNSIGNVFEEPDFYFENENNIFLIEHFEIDASLRNKKGSIDKRDEDIRRKKFNKLAIESGKDNFTSHLDIKVLYKEEYYLKNLFDIFDEHYKRINNYKSNISSKENNNKVLKFGLFIEDTNPLGSYWINKDFEPVVIFRYKEFLNKFEKSKNVDFIFYSNYFNNKTLMWFLSFNEINNISSNLLKEIGNDFCCFEPKEVAFRNIIKK